MQRVFYLFVAVLLAVFIKQASCVVTPSVTIKEENPPRGSKWITKDENGITQIVAFVGKPLALECIPRDVTNTAKVIWKWQDVNNDKNIFHINTDMRSNDISKYKITKGTSAKNAIRLELQTVGVHSAGYLICQVLYQEELSVEARRLIKVYEFPRILQYLSSFETSVPEKKNVTLSCNATGIPKPAIYWMRIGGSSALIRGYGRRYFGGKITFSHVRPSDRGLYRCEAVNAIGMVAWNVQLDVLFVPQVKIFTTGVAAVVHQKVGCRMQLACTVIGNPRPQTAQMRWTNGRGEDVVAIGNRVGTYVMEAADFTTYYLINFYRTEESDFGRYTCSASNEYGTRSAVVDFAASDTAKADRSGRVLCSGSRLSLSFLLLCLGLIVTFKSY